MKRKVIHQGMASFITQHGAIVGLDPSLTTCIVR